MYNLVMIDIAVVIYSDHYKLIYLILEYFINLIKYDIIILYLIIIYYINIYINITHIVILFMLTAYRM